MKEKNNSVVRGGAFCSSPRNVRVVDRPWVNPVFREPDTGFRVVVTQKEEVKNEKEHRSNL